MLAAVFKLSPLATSCCAECGLLLCRSDERISSEMRRTESMRRSEPLKVSPSSAEVRAGSGWTFLRGREGRWSIAAFLPVPFLGLGPNRRGYVSERVPMARGKMCLWADRLSYLKRSGGRLEVVGERSDDMETSLSRRAKTSHMTAAFPFPHCGTMHLEGASLRYSSQVRFTCLQEDSCSEVQC